MSTQKALDVKATWSMSLQNAFETNSCHRRAKKTDLKAISVTWWRYKTCLKAPSASGHAKKRVWNQFLLAGDAKKRVWNQLLSPVGALKSAS